MCKTISFCSSKKPTVTFSYHYIKANKMIPEAFVCTLKQRVFLKHRQKKTKAKSKNQVISKVRPVRDHGPL